MELLRQNARGIFSLIIIAIWGCVTGYFAFRFYRYGKFVSLALAGMAIGWLLIGLERRVPGENLAALLLGLFVLFAIFRVERTGK